MTPTNDASKVDIQTNLPKCCVTGDPDCPHAINKDKKVEIKNVGL